MVARDQPQYLVCDCLKAGSNRFAGVDQDDDVELGLVGTRQAAEVADDHFAVDHGKVIPINGLYQAIVFVSGEERDPHFGGAGAVGNVGSVVLRAGTQKTGKNSEQYCQ